MIVQGNWGGDVRGLSGFGTTSPVSGSACPAGGDYDSWCDCMWPSGEENTKCKSKPLSILTPAPWTAAGAALRGIPFAGSLDLFGTGGGSTGPAPAAPPPKVGLFGIPRIAMFAGLGVLGLRFVAHHFSRCSARKSSQGESHSETGDGRIPEASSMNAVFTQH